MLYTVYKTTNLINGKFYIGTHKTKDPNDIYLGSGKLLKKAIEKYGVDSFKKEVLFIFDNPEAMFAKEAEIVTAEFLAENNTYNLKLGGEGGFDWINSNEHASTWKTVAGRQSRRKHPNAHRPQDTRQKLSVATKRRHEDGKITLSDSFTFQGRNHTAATKHLMAEKGRRRIGRDNPSFGTKWITDGVSNQKIDKNAEPPLGWGPGRVIKPPTRMSSVWMTRSAGRSVVRFHSCPYNAHVTPAATNGESGNWRKM